MALVNSMIALLNNTLPIGCCPTGLNGVGPTLAQHIRSLQTIPDFFVHDGINSVTDYNSLRVGVGWMSDGCLSRGKFHDWITFKRLEILC